MKNKFLLLGLILLVFQAKLNGQCAMCKAVVEANLKEGGSAGAGLNEGILYLMATPNIIIMLFGLFYFLQKRNQKPTA